MSSLWSFIRRYLWPYGWWYVGGTLALFATNALSVTIPRYLAWGIDALGGAEPDGATAMEAAGWIAAMGVAVIGVRTVSRVLFFTPGRLVEAAVKRDLFEAILRHQPSFLRTWETGDLFSRVSSDVSTLRLLAGFGVMQVVNAVIAVGLAATAMASLSPTLALWLFLPIVVSLVVVQGFIQRMFVLMRRMQQELAALSSHILASYRGVATVQGFHAEDAFLERFDRHNEGYLRTMVERSQLRAGLGPVLALATDVDLFLLLFIGGPMVVRGELTIGELVAFTTLVAIVTPPLRASSFLWNIVKSAQASLERIDPLLDTPPERPEGTDGLPAPDRAPALEIRDLRFAYPGAEAPALEGVRFSLPAGGTLGVLGPTGSGKTTLARIIARLENPPRGSVFVDGVDLLDLDLDRWREAMTLVPQRPFLFSERLADNVLLGRDDPEALTAVLERAALRPDIEALPRGVDTLVGEAGVMLSGGQRQRTALARGLLRDHVLLLLDDVLSAVDHATESELLEMLREIGRTERGLTTVLIAHRVSALQHADLVVVLEGGRMVDQGTPAELLQRPGPYLDTWRQQQAAEADA